MDAKIISQNRKMAIATGVRSYNGKLCVNHPDLNGERYTLSGCCIECKRENLSKFLELNPKYNSNYRLKNKENLAIKKSEYNKKNKDRILKAKSKYREKNKDKIKAVINKWHLENPEKVKSYKSKWDKANRHKKNITLSRYRASKKQAVPFWSESEKIKVVYEKAKQYGFDVDHIVPLQSDVVCGLHVWANLQLLDSSINSSKGNRVWPDMP